MARLVVIPETFTMVNFDHARLVELAEEVAGRVGIPADLEVRVEIDEGSPLGRTKLASVDPVTLWMQGGALEFQRTVDKIFSLGGFRGESEENPIQLARRFRELAGFTDEENDEIAEIARQAQEEAAAISQAAEAAG